MPLPRKAAVPLTVPWNPAVRKELAARLRASRPDVVHIHNTFPLLSPSVVAACADAGVPAVATLHNYGMVCPPGTLHRDGHICTECVGGSPLPAVKHGCYRDSRVATLPMAASTAANRRRWWTGIARFFCISAAQRDLLVSAGMPGERMAVKHNFVTDPGVRRTGDGKHVLFLGRVTEEKGVGLLMRAWDRLGGALGDSAGHRGHGPDAGRGRDLGGRPGRRFVRRPAEQGGVPRVDGRCRGGGGAVDVAGGLRPGGRRGDGRGRAHGRGGSHGAFPELVDDGVTGLLHAPNDAESLADRLREVAGDRNHEMGDAARVRYEKDFTPAVGLDRLLAGYEAAIGARG